MERCFLMKIAVVRGVSLKLTVRNSQSTTHKQTETTLVDILSWNLTVIKQTSQIRLVFFLYSIIPFESVHFKNDRISYNLQRFHSLAILEASEYVVLFNLSLRAAVIIIVPPTTQNICLDWLWTPLSCLSILYPPPGELKY